MDWSNFLRSLLSEGAIWEPQSWGPEFYTVLAHTASVHRGCKAGFLAAGPTTHCLIIWGAFKTQKFAFFKVSSIGRSTEFLSACCTLCYVVPCAFSLVCFWFELSGINKTKNPLESTREIGLKKFAFIGEEVKGSVCHQGRDLFILLVGLRLHLRALRCLWRALKDSRYMGGSTGTLNRAKWMISENVQDTLICQRTNSVRRHGLCFQGAHELAGKKRDDLYKVINGIVMPDTNLQGPGG